MVMVSDIHAAVDEERIEKVRGRAEYFAACYQQLQLWLRDPRTTSLNPSVCKRFRGVYCGGMLNICWSVAYISAEPSITKKFFVSNKS